MAGGDDLVTRPEPQAPVPEARKILQKSAVDNPIALVYSTVVLRETSLAFWTPVRLVDTTLSEVFNGLKANSRLVRRLASKASKD